MRSLAVVVVAACSFQPGAFEGSRDAAGGSTVADAPRDTNTTTPIDAMTSPQPDAYVCSTAGLACVGTVVATMCNGGCWVRCTSTFAVPNQFAAGLACANWGGKLAPIRNAGDQACVSQTLFPAQASWIGLQQDPLADELDEGWSNNGDGVAVANPSWDGGQPNDANGSENAVENCAFMNTGGNWHDTSCFDGGLFRFSCRRD